MQNKELFINLAFFPWHMMSLCQCFSFYCVLCWPVTHAVSCFIYVSRTKGTNRKLLMLLGLWQTNRIQSCPSASHFYPISSFLLWLKLDIYVSLMMFNHLHIGILTVDFLQKPKSFTGLKLKLHAVGDISIACVWLACWFVLPVSLGWQCSPSVFLDISLLCLLVMRAA